MAQQRGRVLAWALYDWANSAFATTVLAGFFPVWFKRYWAAGMPVTESTFRLGLASAAASLAVAVLAPVLGAIADRGGARRRFLAAFAAAGMLGTAALAVVPGGLWGLALLVFVGATIGWAGANVFYDALIVGVAPPGRTDRVSALGYALGYLGGGLLFAVNVWMVRDPGFFGLRDAGQAIQVSFVMVAIWWAVFSLPLLRVPEPPSAGRSAAGAVRDGFRQLGATFRQIRRLKGVALFLAAYWLYIDGIDTIIRMAVDYGLSLGFPEESLVAALLLTQFVGFPSALLFGRLAERIGSRPALFIGIGVYVGVTIWAYFLDEVWEFYALAATVGLVQGGVQAASRALYARIIPARQAGEFFGFYNLLGKFAAVIGPVLMGWVGVLTGSPRVAILSVILLFVAGAALLWKVDEDESRREAQALDLA